MKRIYTSDNEAGGKKVNIKCLHDEMEALWAKYFPNYQVQDISKVYHELMSVDEMNTEYHLIFYRNSQDIHDTQYYVSSKEMIESRVSLDFMDMPDLKSIDNGDENDLPI